MLSTQFKRYFYKNLIIKTSRKNKHFLFLLLMFFSIFNFTAYTQEIKEKSSENFKTKLSDTLKFPKKDTLAVKPIDSLGIKPKDSIAKPKELLESIIVHSADSLIRQDLKNKKILLFDNAHVNYNDIDLTAGFIEIDNNTNIITARGIKDSIGSYSQRPVFKQGSQESTQDTIKFNFKTEKAKIWGLKTEQQGIIIRGEVSKKHNDSVIFIENIKLTSSEKEKPDYYIGIKRAKFIKDKKLVAGTSQLVIADVPTPIVLPFAYVPLTKGRTSGVLMPTWGENNRQGYFLQNGGYYFVLNDNFDLALLGDIYTNGSWGMRAESGYAKRYRFTGKFDFKYESLINSLKGLDDYSKSTNYNIRWNHSQDTKASPNSRFSASVNLGSSKYYKESINEYNTNSFLNNNLSSSVSYYKKFVGTPFNMSLSVTHSQNTNTEEIAMTLPSLQVNMDRIYPFTGKGGVKKNAIQKTGLSYSLKGDNRIKTNDEFFFKKEMFEDAKSGIQQDVSLNTNMKALRFFTLSPSVSYKEVWYFDRLNKTYDADNNKVVTDTVTGFNAFREYSGALSLATTFYGMFNFKKGNVEAIRHVVRPSVSYSYRPDFSSYNEEVQKTADPNDYLEYSPFANGIFGSPGTGLSNSLNFSLNNNLEAKLRKKDSTEKEARKINTFNINNGGSLFRLTNAGITMNYSLSSKDDKSKKTSDEKNAQDNNSDGVFGEDLDVTNKQMDNKESDKNKVKETKLYQSKIPWTLQLAYSLNYSNNNREQEISSNSLMFSGDIELTPKWNVGVSSGYDIKNQGFTYTQLRFSRDLDSWKLNFNWVPFGERQTYYFFIGVKSSMLSDLKYDKRQVPDRRLF